MGLNLDEQKAVERFRQQVVEPSMTNLVILDFWAEWCGPCKALAPLLEKVAGEYAEKGVMLAKVNVDEEKFISEQFQVKSIPTVYAIFQGQPVADLTNARSESQLKQVLDQLLDKLPVGEAAGGAQGAGQQDIEPLLAMGEEVLEAGDGERAAGIFAQIAEMAPGSTAAISGLIRSMVVSGKVDQAEALLTDIPAELAADPQIERARAAVDLAKARPDDGELAALREAARAEGASMDARLEYANAAFASGDREDAAETLLAMIGEDNEWNEGAARAKLLQIFEAIGLEDPWVAATRRRLSTLLFG